MRQALSSALGHVLAQLSMGGRTDMGTPLRSDCPGASSDCRLLLG